jgi:hypothetical protein
MYYYFTKTLRLAVTEILTNTSLQSLQRLQRQGRLSRTLLVSLPTTEKENDFNVHSVLLSAKLVETICII